jgi:hypothetical protein
MDFTKTKHYLPFEAPIDMGTFKIVGIFPYGTSCVRPDELSERNKIPRLAASSIENALPRTDNKISVICEVPDNGDCSINNFAVYLHDNGCVFGKHREVRQYSGEDLIFNK